MNDRGPQETAEKEAVVLSARPPVRPEEGKQQLRSSVKMLAAIAHEGRLALIRHLVQAGPDGRSAGWLATAAGASATTVSAQLLVLANAGLVNSQRAARDGRSVIYQANYAVLGGLLGFLMEDCCCARPEICAEVATTLNAVSA